MAASAPPLFLVKAREGGNMSPGLPPSICREAVYVNNDQVIPFSLSAKKGEKNLPFS